MPISFENRNNLGNVSLFNRNSGGSVTMLTPYQIVTSGLVLNLDAGNPASYPGSGTTWTDISGNGYTASLTNGPTYNSANGGSIVFDGINDYAPIIGNSSLITNPNLSQENKTNPMLVLNWYPIYDNFTMEFICNPSASIGIRSESTSGASGTSGQRYITENTKSTNGAGNGSVLVSIGTNAIQVFDHGDNYMPCLLSHQINTNSVTTVSITYNQKTPLLYINGFFIKTGLQSLKTNVELAAYNTGICSTFYTPFSGAIYNVRYYNRTLSATEVLQNYNAQKSRFGL